MSSSSTVQTLLNYLRPYRAEAILRIRSNTISLLVLTLLTYTLPIPSLPLALHSVFVSPEQESTFLKYFCLSEVAIAAVFAFNILEGLYGVKYPRPLPPSRNSTPARVPPPKPPSSSSASRPLSALARKTASVRNEVRSPLSRSQSRFDSSTADSPNPLLASSPSRVPPSQQSVHYSRFLASSSSNPLANSSMPNNTTPGGPSTSISGSGSGLLATSPSPSVAAYRGTHGVDTVAGRPVDGVFMRRLMSVSIDDDD